MSARRKGRRRIRSNVEQKQFQVQRRAYTPIDVLSAEEEQRIHELSLTLLDNTGLKFLLPEALDVLEKNGCRVDRETGNVSFPSEVIEHFLAQAPQSFTLHARNPEHNLHIGGEHIYYGSASSAPNVLDREQGRRPGTRKDFQNLVRLNQALPTCGFHSGHPVEPIDTPPNTRHLLSAYDWHTLSDKACRVYAIGKTRVQDSLAMVEIAHGIDREALQAAPHLHAVININSPLLVDAPLCEAAMEMARNGQLNIVSPVALAGAMSPISLLGSIVQCNAEAIGFIAFLQMVASGSPCCYGVLNSPVDMKSGAPAMGTPEMVTGTLASGQMARRYRIPQRVWLGSTSTSPDAQSAYETMFSLWAAQLSGAHMVYHAHGWMEGGLTTGFEKTVLDSEMIGMMGAMRGRLDFSDADEILDVIHQVGAGGHFLGCEHTMQRYETAFHAPMLSDWKAYEFWEADGSKAAEQRATEKWKSILASFKPPALDESVRKSLEDFVQRREREIGDNEI